MNLIKDTLIYKELLIKVNCDANREYNPNKPNLFFKQILDSEFKIQCTGQPTRLTQGKKKGREIDFVFYYAPEEMKVNLYIETIKNGFIYIYIIKVYRKTPSHH